MKGKILVILAKQRAAVTPINPKKGALVGHVSYETVVIISHRLKTYEFISMILPKSGDCEVLPRCSVCFAMSMNDPAPLRSRVISCYQLCYAAGLVLPAAGSCMHRKLFLILNEFFVLVLSYFILLLEKI